MNPDLHSQLMLYRPMSHMLVAAVIPEVQARLTAGILKETDLPFPIYRFQVLMGKAGNRVVQLNEDVQIQLETTVRRPVKTGDPITIEDIDPASTHIVPPELDGRRVSYYSAQSFFLTVIGLFDFTPNAPDGPSGQQMSYPVVELAQAKGLKDLINPDNAIRDLKAHDWPPGRLFFPHVLLGLVNGITTGSPEFIETVKKAYSSPTLKMWADFWDEIKAFPNRLPYLRHATDRYFAGDFVSAVRVIAPEFEGVIREHLSRCGTTPPRGQKPTLAAFRHQITSRKIILFSPTLLNTILDFIEQSFLGATESIHSPNAQINRHGLLHGVFNGVESEEIALKYLVLFDALAFVILHDKLVTNSMS
jgi:hypothetical protein